MKDKSFRWVLKQLLQSNCKLPILDTYICVNKTIQAKFSVDSKMEVTKQYLSRPVSEFAKDSLRSTELFYNSTWSKVDSHSDIPSALCYLQSSFPSESNRYTFSVLFSMNGYTGSLLKESVPFKNPQIYAKAKDLTTVVINSIEKMSCMRVISLELEYLESLDKQLWLSKVFSCSLIDESDLPKEPLSSVNDILKLKKRSKSSMPKLGKVLPSKRKIPIEPLRIISPEPSFSDNSIREERSFKSASKQGRLSQVFLECVCKTNLALKKQKTISEEDIKTEHERLQKLSKPQINKQVESFACPEVKPLEEPNSLQKQFSMHIAEPPKPTRKTARKGLGYMHIQKRKAYLIDRFLAKGTLVPHVSAGYIGKYKECFKPIRIVR